MPQKNAVSRKNKVMKFSEDKGPGTLLMVDKSATTLPSIHETLTNNTFLERSDQKSPP